MAVNFIPELTRQLRQFASDRDWQQFHTPKNLAMALAVEAAELQEIFQWLTPEQSSHLPADEKVRVAREIADVLLYLLRLSDVMEIDVEQAAWDKLSLNADKYPAEKVRGKADKYTSYEQD